jgi:hypothetical protein
MVILPGFYLRHLSRDPWQHNGTLVQFNPKIEHSGASDGNPKASLIIFAA